MRSGKHVIFLVKDEAQKVRAAQSDNSRSDKQDLPMDGERHIWTDRRTDGRIDGRTDTNRFLSSTEYLQMNEISK